MPLRSNDMNSPPPTADDVAGRSIYDRDDAEQHAGVLGAMGHISKALPSIIFYGILAGVFVAPPMIYHRNHSDPLATAQLVNTKPVVNQSQMAIAVDPTIAQPAVAQTPIPDWRQIVCDRFRNYNPALDVCVRDEQLALDYVRAVWSDLSENDRKYCLKEELNSNVHSYQVLAAVIETRIKWNNIARVEQGYGRKQLH